MTNNKTTPSPGPLQEAASSSKVLADYQQALAWHQQGQLANAEAVYRNILQIQPNHAETLQMLGVIALQTGHLQDAVTLIGQSLAINPNQADAHSNLGVALQELQRFEEALACLDLALQLNPDYIDALINCGNVLRDLNRLEEALVNHDRVLHLQPDNVLALYNRGMVLLDLNRQSEALTCFDRVISLQPNNADVFRLRGNILKSLNRLPEALSSYEKALRIDPTDVETLNNRGNILREQNRLEEALASFVQALQFRQDLPQIWSNNGLTLYCLQRMEEAVASFERALHLDPKFAEAHYYRGNAMQSLEKKAEAMASYDRCLEIDPNHLDALKNKIFLLFDLHRNQEASKLLSHMLAIAPNHPFVLGYKLYAERLSYDWDRYSESKDKITHGLRQGRYIDAPFSFLALSDSAADQLHCAQIFSTTKVPHIKHAHWKGRRYRHDKIRIAYLSPDFREHPMPGLMVQVFETHDRDRFETMAFAFGPKIVSEMESRLSGAFDRYIDIRMLSDEKVAKQIRDLEVDIAVDMAGYTSICRLGIFSLRPAPIQVNYLGFPGTLGIDCIDYIIADDFVIPKESQKHYSEHVVYLPDCFQANDDQKAISQLPMQRIPMGLNETGFVFCSFNQSFKCNPEMFDIWMRLLHKVPGSMLWMLAESSYAQDNIRNEAAKRGIDPNRLVFAFRLNYPDHLARLRLADLFLDTLPFNAGTTASDALWAGVPLVTCPGEAFASRMAGSLLRAVGLPELITHNLEEYEALALKLATSPSLLADIKAKLAHNRTTYPLFNSDRFRRHLESAYITMWERHQRGEPPKAFAVKPINST